MCHMFCAFINWFSKCIWKSDLFNIHSIRQSVKDMESGHKLSSKFMEAAHIKVLESHRKLLSLFCVHPDNTSV